MEIKLKAITPTEPGALHGWSVECDECGRSGSASLAGMADRLLKDHTEWHVKREAEKLAATEWAVADQVRVQIWDAITSSGDGDERLDAAGQLGGVLHVLLYPREPDNRDRFEAVRRGVKMFLDDLESD